MLLSTLLLGTLCVAAPAPAETKNVANWPAALQNRDFRLDDEACGVESCAVAARKAGVKVEIPPDQDTGRSFNITFSLENRTPVLMLSHALSAYAVMGDHLFFADFSSYGNGCKVLAVDLKNDKIVWSEWVKGIGPIAHSKYRNRVTIKLEKHPTADAWGVVVTGHETSGRYVEVLDPATGKMLANRKYDEK